MKASVLAEPILVGRERELWELRCCLDLAVGGKGTTVFISGEAGAGKTRLTSEFFKLAEKQGVDILSGWCLSNAAVPYFPFFEAFKVFFSEKSQQEKIRLEELEVTGFLVGPGQSEKVARPQTISPQVWKDQTFAAVTKTISVLSAKKPIILFIDDVHWADSASLALIHYIARAIVSERVLLLATFRSEQLTPDGEGRPHPLVETLRLMGREELFKEIKITKLDETNVSALAKNVLGGDLQPGLAEKLTEKSQGNPLFVVESLRMLYERGGLVQEGKQWRLSVDAIGIPPKIKDIILQRVSVLPRGQRRVLDAASIIGQKFNVGVLGFMLGLNSLEIIETLDAIAKDTSLVHCEGELYLFDNIRSREAIYDDISPALKREYHVKVAETLESTSENGRLPFSEIAYHYAQAGKKEKAVKYALAAGQDALVRWSNSQAIEHFMYVLQNISEGHTEEKRRALEGLGDAYAGNYMYEEAIKTFDELAVSEVSSIRLRALRKAMDAAYHKGDKPDLLLDYAKKAEELGVCDRLEMARVLDDRARAFHWAGRGDLRKDLEDYNAALQIFEEENSLPDVAEALSRSGAVCTHYEDLQEKGLGELLRSVAIFRELGDVRKETITTFSTGYGLLMSGLFPEARRELDSFFRLGEKLGLFAELARASTFLGSLDEGDGKLTEALSHDLKAMEYAEKTDAYYTQGLALTALTRIYSKLGDLKRADEYFDRMTKVPTEGLLGGLGRFFVALSKGVYFAAEGRWEESNHLFEKLAESSEFSTTFSTILSQLLLYNIIGSYAWALEKQGRVEEAIAQRDRIKKILEQVEEKFGHANVQLSVMVPRKVQVSQEFEMRLHMVNVGRKSALLVEITNVMMGDFKVSSLPTWCNMEDGAIKVKNKEICPFQVVAAKFSAISLNTGTFTLTPKVTYLDDLGETKNLNLSPITITVNPPTPKERVCGKISTGTPDLDQLLLGGIPEDHAVVLAAPSSDEKALLIQNFLKAGTKADETTFYVTADLKSGKDLAEKYPRNFRLILCNIQADTMIENAPNVFKLKGVENLTEIEIALTKAFRTLDASTIAPRRICIDLLSDVLLQHHGITTRRWLSALLPTLKSRGFTVLATVNPRMHPPEESEAVIGLFDGEMSICEKRTQKEVESFLKVTKMIGQKYLRDEMPLTSE